LAGRCEIPRLRSRQHRVSAGTSAREINQFVWAAVDIRKSVFADHLVCLEDGKRVTMLKRHLRTAHGLTPELYRTRWGLASTYPKAAPNYAEVRSGLAKATGLGRYDRPWK
jgi:predicted transcriptional regulator